MTAAAVAGDMETTRLLYETIERVLGSLSGAES